MISVAEKLLLPGRTQVNRTIRLRIEGRSRQKPRRPQHSNEETDSAFYQAGGAYSFRDQLQDIMALTVAQRDVARARALDRSLAVGSHGLPLIGTGDWSDLRESEHDPRA